MKLVSSHYKNSLAIAALVSFSMINSSDGNIHSRTDDASTDVKTARFLDTGYEKPRAPVEISHEVVGVPQVGEPIIIRVRVTPASLASLIDVSFDLDDVSRGSSVLYEASLVPPFEGKSQVASLWRELSVSRNTPGPVNVKVSASVYENGKVAMRSKTISIHVGDYHREPLVNSHLIETSDGELIVSMPAMVP